MKRYQMVCFLFSLFLVLMGFKNAAAQENLRGNFKKRLKERLENRRIEGQQVSREITNAKRSLTHAGVTRTYLLHVPRSYKPTIPTPLILAFHGGGGSSEIMAEDKYYNLISKSEKEGFIVVFPNGSSAFKSGKFATWNAGNCCAYARDNNSDDVGFVKVLLKELKKEFNINKNKVYAIGMSNGGMFSYKLACDLTDEFKAIASVAGTDNTKQCFPSRPISIMHIHAKDDTHVLFNGGAGKDAFKDDSKVTDFTSVASTISKWVNIDHCNKTPQRIKNKDGVYFDLYSGCDNDTEILLCVTETGGHSWPGGIKPRKESAAPSNSISAVDEIWSFFKRLPN